MSDPTPEHPHHPPEPTVPAELPGPPVAAAKEAVDRWLAAASDGDPNATGALVRLLYDELRRLADAQIRRERPGHTLQATALVHEAYLRLASQPDARWDGRGHFFAAAAQAMRRILVEAARRKKRIRHGGGRERVELHADSIALPEGAPHEILDLEEAIAKLEARDRRKAEIVHLRYYAGLSFEEIADLLGLGLTTIKDDWTFARAWLRREMGAHREERERDGDGAGGVDR